MSNVTVTLPPDTERKLREKATSAGLTLETYLSRLAETDATNGTLPRNATFDEILAPIRKGFAESGMTEDELTELFHEARQEVWQENQRKQSNP